MIKLINELQDLADKLREAASKIDDFTTDFENGELDVEEDD